MSHCATSLDEFTIGQHVKVVVGLGCVKPGVVGDITNTKVVVLFDDGGCGFYRPYAVMPGPLAPTQGELFGLAELLEAPS